MWLVIVTEKETSRQCYAHNIGTPQLIMSMNRLLQVSVVLFW